jgi:hypothetical protein
MPHYRNKSNSGSYPILVPFAEAKAAYFIFNGVQSISQCKPATFRDAVLALMPQWESCDTYAQHVACPQDLVTKWFLLNALAEAGKPMKLFESPEKAEQSLSDLCLDTESK